jgi:hypothetical protein
MNDGFWHGANQPRDLILYGRIQEENPKHPGTYRFLSTDGFVFPDAQILTPDGDNQRRGQNARPVPGSICVAGTTHDGAQCFILGFSAPPTFNEESDDPPQVGNPADNNTGGDKVWNTEGGATFILKRGGAVIVEGGAGVGMILNPLNNTMSLRATNFTHIADGYRASRGREEPGTTRPTTVHQEEFWHQVGPVYDRVRLRHGDLDDGVRREFTVDEVHMARSKEFATTRTRERYYADGSWVGEGPKYQYGGLAADQAMVLGNALVEVLSTLFDIIKNLKVNTAWGPSTPPIPPTPIELEKLKSELVGKILSTFMFLTKNPAL